MTNYLFPSITQTQVAVIGVAALFVWINRQKAKLLADKTATAAADNPGKNGSEDKI
jgi:hypothetical protein